MNTFGFNYRGVGRSTHMHNELRLNQTVRHRSSSSNLDNQYSNSVSIATKYENVYNHSHTRELPPKDKNWSRSAQMQQYNFREDEDEIASQNELRKKTKELHQILNKRKDIGPMSTKGAELLPTLPATKACAVDTVFTADTNGRGANEKEKCVKHIVVSPDHRSLTGNESSGVEICKKLFGIIVFEYSNGKSTWNHVSKERKLVVQGIIEGSTSHSSGRIHRGDMLIRINDSDVSWHNFTRLLSSLNKREKVKLTFQSPRIVGPNLDYNVLQVPEGDFCLAVVGKNLSQIQSDLSHLACVALYLSLVPSSHENEVDDKEDIIYAFPEGEEKITTLRGLFMTLSSILVDIVGQPASCSHLSLNGVSVNVAYKQCGRDVLVFAMPEDRISKDGVVSVLEAFSSLMTLLFIDIKSAFSDCDRNWLDKVLAVMFHQALDLHSALPASPSSFPSSPLTPERLVLTVLNYHTAKALDLSHENKLICDEILSEFESMDFDDHLDPSDLFSRKQYTVQGTCLFYKDHILSTHLAADYQRDTNLFLNCHGLLALASRQPVEQVLIWQELKFYAAQDVTALPVGYRPCQARDFLLVVGRAHYLLAAVIEAGGCSQAIQGPVYPHPLLIEQARSTLAQLETEDVHVLRLSNCTEGISLASTDQLCQVIPSRSRRSSQDAGGFGKFSEAQNLSLSPTKAISKNPFFRSKSVDRMDDKDDTGSGMVIRRQGSKLSYGSNDSTGSGSSTGPSKNKGSRVSSVADLPSIVRSMSGLHIETSHDVRRGGRLSRGRQNILFNFVQLHPGEGILISPTEVELRNVSSILQQQVIDNFYLACQKMRLLFTAKAPIAEREQSVFNTSNAAGDFKEAGTLFYCTFQSSLDKKQQVSTLHYWVIGRCWSNLGHQEMYVCFHESTSQALVEMAFSLAFGT